MSTAVLRVSGTLSTQPARAAFIWVVTIFEESPSVSGYCGIKPLSSAESTLGEFISPPEILLTKSPKKMYSFPTSRESTVYFALKKVISKSCVISVARTFATVSPRRTSFTGLFAVTVARTAQGASVLASAMLIFPVRSRYRLG